MKNEDIFWKTFVLCFVLKRIATSNPSFYNISVRIGYVLLQTNLLTSQQELFFTREKSTWIWANFPGSSPAPAAGSSGDFSLMAPTESTLVSLITVAAKGSALIVTYWLSNHFYLHFVAQSKSCGPIFSSRVCNHPMCLQGEKKWKTWVSSTNG